MSSSPKPDELTTHAPNPLNEAPTSANVAVASSKPKKFRDPWFDNIRLTAALLIVVGHFISPMVKMENNWHLIWMMTWAMRVPVFVLISGYFSWGRSHTRKSMLSLIRNVLLVYLSFQIISTVLTYLYEGKWKLNPLEPAFGLWFLLCLFTWRILLPYLLKIPYIMVWSFAAAVLVGFVPWIGGQFALSRSIVMLPIFLLGYKLREHGLRKLLDNTKARVGAVAVLVAYWAFMYFNSAHYRRSVLGFGDPYLQELGPFSEQTLFRAGAVLVGAIVGVAVMTLVPRGRIPWITYLGSGSLYIYLIHPILFRIARWEGLYDWIDSDLKALFVIISALVVSTLCATKPVRRALGWLIQPKYYVPFLSEPKQKSAKDAA